MINAMSSTYEVQSDWLWQICNPMLKAWSNGVLLEALKPSEFSQADRAPFACLEAVARATYALVGAFPSGSFITDAYLEGMKISLDKTSDQAFNWSRGGQPLVDAAILAAAFLQNPEIFEKKLPLNIQDELVKGWRISIKIMPPETNWILFPALIEAALRTWDKTESRYSTSGVLHRVKLGFTYWKKPFYSDIGYAVRRFEDWYKGDGFYSDGQHLRMDYYNSIMIHPFLLFLGILGFVDEDIHQQHIIRARRYAQLLVRSVHSDGTFPPLGRSLTYRAGLFHHLAFMVRHELISSPEEVIEVQSALNRVILATLDLTEQNRIGDQVLHIQSGILRPGLYSFQPELAESYISTGSLYLNTWAFLPLGLGKTHSYWVSPLVNSEGNSSNKRNLVKIDKWLK